MVTPLALVAAATLPVLVVWAGAVDIVTRSIPNALILMLAACFVVFAGAAGITAAQVFAHLACSCVVLAGTFLLFCHGLIGGGDAKLLAGTAFWFGFETIPQFLVWVALAGGAIALAYLTANTIKAQFGLAPARVLTIPYGAAIAAGALAVLPEWLATF